MISGPLIRKKNAPV